jgi:phosphate transport system permease protein
MRTLPWVAQSLMAIAVALPLGVGTAVYLTEYTRETRLTRAIGFGTDCLAGIPSIIFGLFGFIFFVTMLGWGWCLLSGGQSSSLRTRTRSILGCASGKMSSPKSFG